MCHKRDVFATPLEITIVDMTKKTTATGLTVKRRVRLLFD
jgi:hypothetical protein